MLALKLNHVRKKVPHMCHPEYKSKEISDANLFHQSKSNSNIPLILTLFQNETILWSINKMAHISQTPFSNIFLEWKLLYFYSYFTEVCALRSYVQWTKIDLGFNLAPDKWQIII